MSHYYQRPIYVIMLWALTTSSACLWVSSTQQGAYTEDLAQYRKQLKHKKKKREDSARTPKRSVQRKDLQDITTSLDELLVSNKRQQIPGYTIQAYTGSKREAALKTRSTLREQYPDLTVSIEHNGTNYSVQVGKFPHKIEAERVFARIQQTVPDAIIRRIHL